MKKTRHKKYSEQELLEIIPNYSAAIVGSDPFTKQVIEAGKKLKILAKNGVGVDNIDLQAAAEHDIIVTNTPGTVETSVAETTIGLILALYHNICIADRQQRQGKWPRMIGNELSGKTIGIVGLGHIGKKVAAYARAFSMNVQAYDPLIDLDYCLIHNICACSFEELIATSDIVSIHTPLSPGNSHLIDKNIIRAMKSNACLINTARGGLVDEEALYEALKNHTIRAAAIDCFSHEPTIAGNRFFDLDNCIVTPHIAGYSQEANSLSGMIAAKSIVAVFEGMKPEHIVN